MLTILLPIVNVLWFIVFILLFILVSIINFGNIFIRITISGLVATVCVSFLIVSPALLFWSILASIAIYFSEIKG